MKKLTKLLLMGVRAPNIEMDRQANEATLAEYRNLGYVVEHMNSLIWGETLVMLALLTKEVEA